MQKTALVLLTSGRLVCYLGFASAALSVRTQAQTLAGRGLFSSIEWQDSTYSFFICQARIPEGKISPEHIAGVQSIDDPTSRTETIKKAAKEELCIALILIYLNNESYKSAGFSRRDYGAARENPGRETFSDFFNKNPPSPRRSR
jgi:hypothetical protein